MNTTVVCVKVGAIRPRYNDLVQWMEDPNNIYIGRAGIVFVERNGTKTRFPPQNSIWANPFKEGKDGTRDEIILKYQEYIWKRICEDTSLQQQLYSLQGKTLGCWCKPNRCHGDVLLSILEYVLRFTPSV